MGLTEKLELWDFQPYIGDQEENDRIELGDRAARNWVGASICNTFRGPDAVFSWGNFMFMQVVMGLRPYRKRAPKKWMPNPAVLREIW